MTDTWGIPGPAFAGIYLFLLLIPMAYAGIAVARARVGTPAAEPLRRVEEAALLAGGPERVGDAVVAAMIAREQLRVDSFGRLHRTSSAPDDELGRVAVEFVRPKGSSPDAVRRGVSESPAVKALVSELTGRGLLVDPEDARRPWKATSVAYGVLIALGVVRLIAGAQTNHPVGFLVALLVLAVALGVFSLVWATRPVPVTPTRAGRASLEDAQVLPEGPVGAVVLSGLDSHPDRAVREAIARATPPRRSRANGWAAASGGGMFFGGGGSSCGGGGASCGGGGGGGCGG